MKDNGKEYQRLHKKWKRFSRMGSFWHSFGFKAKVVMAAAVIGIAAGLSSLKAQTPQMKNAMKEYIGLARAAQQQKEIVITKEMAEAAENLAKAYRLEIKEWLREKDINMAQEYLLSLQALARAYKDKELLRTVGELYVELSEAYMDDELSLAAESFRTVDLDSAFAPTAIDSLDVELKDDTWEFEARRGHIRSIFVDYGKREEHKLPPVPDKEEIEKKIRAKYGHLPVKILDELASIIHRALEEYVKESKENTHIHIERISDFY